MSNIFTRLRVPVNPLQQGNHDIDVKVYDGKLAVVKCVSCNKENRIKIKKETVKLINKLVADFYAEHVCAEGPIH